MIWLSVCSVFDRLFLNCPFNININKLFWGNSLKMGSLPHLDNPLDLLTRNKSLKKQDKTIVLHRKSVKMFQKTHKGVLKIWGIAA